MIPVNGKTIESIIENADNHLLISAKNKTLKRSLKILKYSFLCILMLFISGLVLVISFLIYHNYLITQLKQSFEKYQQQTELINQLTQYLKIDNQTIQQFIQQSIDQQRKDLTNKSNKTLTLTCK